VTAVEPRDLVKVREEEHLPDGSRVVRWAESVNTVEPHEPAHGRVTAFACQMDPTLPGAGWDTAAVTVLVPREDAARLTLGTGVHITTVDTAPAVTAVVEPERTVIEVECDIDHGTLEQVPVDLLRAIRVMHDADHPDPRAICQHPVCREVREYGWDRR